MLPLNTKTDSIVAYNQTHGLKVSVIELYIDYKKRVWFVTENHWTSKKTIRSSKSLMRRPVLWLLTV